MELDMYNKDLRLAVEMNGPLHYKYIPEKHASREDFEEIQKCDKRKIDLCSAHGVKLIVIPYDDVYEKHKNTGRMLELLRTELKAKGYQLADPKTALVFQTYRHQRVIYNYGRNKALNEDVDRSTKALRPFLERVEREVPPNIFNNQAIPRASKQALALPKALCETIRKELAARGLVRMDILNDRAFVRIAEGVVKDGHVEKVHDKVVQKVLLEGDGVVAVEVPVWARDKSMTGHVDIVRIDKDVDGVPHITVSDFKTEDEVEFPRFVPQVEAYARMLRSQLGGASGVWVECVLFNKDTSWRWEPGVLARLAAVDLALKQALDGDNEKRKRNG
jgi:hypothetical protein